MKAKKWSKTKQTHKFNYYSKWIVRQIKPKEGWNKWNYQINLHGDNFFFSFQLYSIYLLIWFNFWPFFLRTWNLQFNAQSLHLDQVASFFFDFIKRWCLINNWLALKKSATYSPLFIYLKSKSGLWIGRRRRKRRKEEKKEKKSKF